MAEQAPATPDYTMGYSEEFLQLLHRRSAQTHAAYLLPHLKPGLRVLDFGCGPGTISVGLAKAVEPGEIHGIDMEESQIGLARAAAQAGGHANATFPRRRRDGPAVRRRLVRRRPLPRGAHARSGHEGGPGRGEAGPKAGGHHRQPRDVCLVLALGAGGGGNRRRMGHVRETSRRERRASPDGEGAEEGVSRCRVHGYSGDCFLRLLREGRGRRLPACFHHGLVLLASGHSGRDEFRAGDQRAVRRMAPESRRVEGRSRGPLEHSPLASASPPSRSPQAMRPCP